MVVLPPRVPITGETRITPREKGQDSGVYWYLQQNNQDAVITWVWTPRQRYRTYTLAVHVYENTSDLETRKQEN